MNKEYIINQLNILFPNPQCELIYNKDYELLIAVMLSAQTTDKAVNKVTNEIFKTYSNLDKINASSIQDLEKIILPIGNYHKKSNYIKDIVKSLINEHNYIVPKDKSQLMKMSGVGNKTSNVFLAVYYNMPSFPVDTHVYRISLRFGLIIKKDSVLVCEQKLMLFFNEKDWIKLHHQFIHFGRNICKAIKPICCKCPFIKYCKYKKVMIL